MREFFSAGSQEALLENVRRIVPQLVHGADAEDIAQEVLVKLIQRGALSFNSYEVASLTRQCLAVAFRHTCTTVVPMPASLRDFAPTPEESAIGNEYSRLLQHAVESLPAELSTIVVLRYYHGFEITEVARKLRQSPDVVENHIRRALRLLREALAHADVALTIPTRSRNTNLTSVFLELSELAPGLRAETHRLAAIPSVTAPDVPPAQELSHLPRWAIVAFAAHCARLAHTAQGGDWDTLTPKQSERVLRSVIKAEASAADGNDPAIRYDGSPYGQYNAHFTHETNLRSAASEIPPKRAALLRAVEAAEAAACCSETAGIAKAHYGWSGYGSNAAMFVADLERQADKRNAAYAFDAGRGAVGAGVPTEAVWKAFDQLREAAQVEHWSDRDPVYPEFFSPDSRIERLVMLAVNELCVRLCELIATDSGTLKHVEWRQLEQVVALALEGIGFEVSLTPASKDGGKDVVATCRIRGNIMTYYIEIKHWREKRVGHGEISSFVEVNAKDGTSGGLFLSTSGFAHSVFARMAEITQLQVRLGRDTKVVSLCQHFVQRRLGAMWETTDVLPKLLFEDTEPLDSARAFP